MNIIVPTAGVPYSIREASSESILEAVDEMQNLFKIIYRIEKMFEAMEKQNPSSVTQSVFYIANHLVVEVLRKKQYFNMCEEKKDISFSPKEYFLWVNNVFTQFENIIYLNSNKVKTNPVLKANLQFVKDKLFAGTAIFPVVKHCQMVLDESLKGED